jgi:hypothetical protein
MHPAATPLSTLTVTDTEYRNAIGDPLVSSSVTQEAKTHSEATSLTPSLTSATMLESPHHEETGTLTSSLTPATTVMLESLHHEETGPLTSSMTSATTEQPVSSDRQQHSNPQPVTLLRQALGAEVYQPLSTTVPVNDHQRPTSVSWADSLSRIPVRNLAQTPSRRQRRQQRWEQHQQRIAEQRMPSATPSSAVRTPLNRALQAGNHILQNQMDPMLAQELAIYIENFHQEVLRSYPHLAVGQTSDSALAALSGTAPVAALAPAPAPVSVPAPQPAPAPVGPPASETSEDLPSDRSSPPSGPSPPASVLGDHPRKVAVLLWTPEGRSFWIRNHSSPSVTISHDTETHYTYRVPNLTSHANPSSTALDKMWQILHHIGVDIQDLAQHGSVRTPVRVTEIEEIEAFTLRVEKSQVDEARRSAELRPGNQQRRLPRYSWVTIADTALESELTEFEPLGLQIWAALTTTEEYLFREMTEGQRATPTVAASAAATTNDLRSPPSTTKVRFAASDPKPSTPGLLPIDQRLAQFPGHHELMGEASPSEVYRESKTVADVLKLVKDIPMYPSSPDLVSTDADIAALPPFTEALVSFLSTGVVTFALGRMSTYRQGLTIITMGEILREVAQRRLQARSLTFLKQGGILNSEAWNQRYSALAPFLADVARSVLDDIALVGLAGNVMRMTQRREEMARMFATRLVSWHEVVQMLADTMTGCPPISNQQLLYQFWTGLRLRQAVMDRLIEDRLDLQNPSTWESLHPGSTALQHIITVATKLERSEMLSAPRVSPTPATAARNPNWRTGRTSSRLNAVQDAGEEEETEMAAADLRVQHSVPTPPPGLTRPPRRCYVCDSDTHLWANCPNEAKKKAWIADAPARLARRRAANDSHLAALEADLEDLEDEAEALEYFQGEESAAASSSDQLSADEE